MDDVYSKCVCGCCVSCSGCACAEICAEKAYKDLVRRFDKDVVCYEPEERCCEHKYGGISCEPRKVCLDWIDTKCSCIGHFCSPPPTISMSGVDYEIEDNLNTIFFSDLDCNCKYWVENKLAASYDFVCEDHKYYVPSEKGPVPLKFGVTASAKWRCPDSCLGIAKCRCPSDAEDCKDCECPPCPNNPCW